VQHLGRFHDAALPGNGPEVLQVVVVQMSQEFVRTNGYSKKT
jgi:hypothetical protein